MVRLHLSERRTALVLYAFLVVLPTLVMVGLHWFQLEQDHAQRLASVPADSGNASMRLSAALRQRLDTLVEAENRRPFFHYRATFHPPTALGTDLAFLPSPLEDGPRPTGILGWFTYDLRRGREAPVEVFGGEEQGREGWFEREAEYLAAAAALVKHDWEDGELRRVARYGPGYREYDVPLQLAAINTSPERDIDCIRAELPALAALENETVRLHVYDFHLRFYHDDAGVPRILATRLMLFEAHRKLHRLPDCFSRLATGASVVQGFLIDPAWLFDELPRSLAAQVLDPSQQFLGVDAHELRQFNAEHVSRLALVREFGFETYAPQDLEYGEVGVKANATALRALLDRQSWRFVGVAAMMLVSLALGLVLLFRSVRRDLEQARRTENFVAAVSHELRTPVAAIKLYGEMLRDGWAPDPDRQAEYHQRIVAESARLEMLVERVLEKSRLDSEASAPQPMDLSASAEPILQRLALAGPTQGRDLAHELARDLPPALLTPEGLGSILVNLVENARKYAPPGRDGRSSEPIVVRTRLEEGQPVLEVLDRGPGIPEAERERVFEAFYRIGNEATRTARGTGLGLHLVRLQALAMGGRAAVHPRSGGGSVFRVTFRSA